MSKTLNSRQQPWFERYRCGMTISLLTVLTPLLLHPDIPLLMKSLTGMASPGIRNFGYFAHLSAYFGVSLLILMFSAPTTFLRTAMILTVLSLHAATTELLQIWVPARDCDPWDLLFNLGGILTATIPWQTLQYVRSENQGTLHVPRRIPSR